MLHCLISSFYKGYHNITEITYLKIKWHLTYKYENHIIYRGNLVTSAHYKNSNE